MTRVAHFLVALLLLPLAAACGGDEYQPPPGGGPVIVDKDEQRRKREAKEKREAGKLLQQGDGYWYVRPRAWRDRTRGYQDLIPFLDDAINERVDDELLAQVMFTTILPGGPYLDGPFEDQQGEFGRHMRRIATGVDRRKITTIDRKEAIHHTGIARGGAFEAQLDQFVVLNGIELYTITFKLDVDNSERQRERLIRSVLDSWHWED
jgi:hypothetical protein